MQVRRTWTSTDCWAWADRRSGEWCSRRFRRNCSPATTSCPTIPDLQMTLKHIPAALECERVVFLVSRGLYLGTGRSEDLFVRHTIQAHSLTAATLLHNAHMQSTQTTVVYVHCAPKTLMCACLNTTNLMQKVRISRGTSRFRKNLKLAKSFWNFFSCSASSLARSM